MQVYKDIRKAILDCAKYKEIAPNSKEISASEFGGDLFKIWLKQKYGVIEEDKISHNTIGSLFHIAMEKVLKHLEENNEDYAIDTEVPLVPYKYKDFKITGTADAVVQYKDKYYIIDYKLIHEYSEKMLMQDIAKNNEHNYIWQLNIYRWLYYLGTGKDADIYILAFSRGKGLNRKNKTFIEPISFIEIPKIPFSKIEEKVKEVIDWVVQNENNKKEAMNHCDQFEYGAINNVPVKCEYYCSYKNVCPLYKNNSYMKKINF